MKKTCLISTFLVAFLFTSSFLGVFSAKAEVGPQLNKEDNESANRPALIISEDESIIEKGATKEFVFSVENEGSYCISFRYISESTSLKQLETAIFVDGKLPNAGMSDLTLRRWWSSDEGAAVFVESGNDRRPSYQESKDWRKYTVGDGEVYQDKEYVFALSAGQHSITFVNGGEPFRICELMLEQAEAKAPSYDEYIKNHNSVSQYDGKDIELQAEHISSVNSRSIVAVNDMSDPVTYPSDYQYIKLNALGGSNWKYSGDTAEWIVNTEKEGLYRIGIRFKQNYYSGNSTYRKLRVNGEVPFKEAESLPFPYGIGWQETDFDGKLFYLKKGENRISLESVIGDNQEILGGLEQSVYDLNRLYRQIITVTGTSPDIYRDYSLETEITGFSEQLQEYLKKIKELSKTVDKTYTASGSETATLQQVRLQLSNMVEDPSCITKSSKLSRFKSNISSLGTWANKLREQPLLLDVIRFTACDSGTHIAKSGFFGLIKYRFLRFLNSFVTDYSIMNANDDTQYKEAIRVWVSTGRDQAQLLKNMVEDTFSTKYGISVNVELVSGGLIEAILAGRGPDVALDRAETDPVNFAMRNALVDLTEFSDFDEVTKRFCEGSMTPFEYRGGCYALPVTQTFEMLFYRTDIFEELKIEVPKTWEDMILYVLPVLQNNNMTAGVGQLTDCSIFKTLLYQMGGSIYNSDLTASALDTQTAYEAFKTAVRLYTDYDMPQSYDFMNRFRTGEMPLAVGSYILYNNLKLGAPELNGMWEMVEIPGCKQQYGSINNTQIMTSTAAVITKNCKNPDLAWQFLTWFLSSETQGRYGNDLEAILGAAGRYNPSGIEAMSQLPWGSRQLELLESQRSKVTALPNIPGSYFTQRAIHNAFVSTVIDSANTREQLLYWNEEINFELERKRIEFS